MHLTVVLRVPKCKFLISRSMIACRLVFRSLSYSDTILAFNNTLLSLFKKEPGVEVFHYYFDTVAKLKVCKSTLYYMFITETVTTTLRICLRRTK